jgi:CBS-domain-containing membrane protein
MIMAMAKLTIVHPPVGASALLFAGGQTWSNILTMLFGNVIAILFAIIINNYNQGQSYPTYWGVGFFVKHYITGKKEK